MTRALPPHLEPVVRPARARCALWRTGLGIAAILAIYMGTLGALLGLFILIEGPAAASLLTGRLASGSTPGAALGALATFVPLFVGVLLVVRLWHRRPAGTVFGPAAKVLREFCTAAAIFAAIYALFLAVWLSLTGSTPNLPFDLWLKLLPLTCLALLIQTGAEEALFRGYIQQQLAARTALRTVWMVLPAFAFGALHFDQVRLGELAPFAAAGAFIFGLISADLTARTGSIGAAWGAHFVNNLAALGIIATDGTMVGLALRVTQYDIGQVAAAPILSVIDLMPMLVAWLVLRRWLGVRGGR